MISPFQIFGEALAGWLLADLITGAFHWWEDRIGREDMPIIGAWLVTPNRLHHTEPLAFTRGSLMDRSLAIFVTAAIVGLAWLMVFGPSVLLVALCLGGALSNEVHRLAHLPKPRPCVAILQEIGLFQSSRQHAAHHRPPSESHYCVLTSWLNPPLDALRFWSRLEAVLMRLGLCKAIGA